MEVFKNNNKNNQGIALNVQQLVQKCWRAPFLNRTNVMGKIKHQILFQIKETLNSKDLSF